MAANPVAAFLAGFQAVDNLETNRQQRQFAQEQQSQLRKLWGRQDEMWARDQMALRQQENYQQYQISSEALMDEIAMQAEKVYEANLNAAAPTDTNGKQLMTSQEAADEAKASYLNQWFSNKTMVNGKPAGFIRFSTEVVNRMIAANPEFGEHLALTTGFDAAAGELIADRRNPVTGVIGVPPEADPEGKGGFIPQVNATTGRGAPGTVNRTASDNDPLYVGRVNAQVLSKLFGGQILTSQDRLAIMLRNQFGVEPGSVTQQAAESGSAGGTQPQQKPVPQDARDAQIAVEAEAFADNDAANGRATEPTQREVGSMMGVSTDQVSSAMDKRAAVQERNRRRQEEEMAEFNNAERPREASSTENLAALVDYTTGHRTNLAPTVRPGTDAEDPRTRNNRYPLTEPTEEPGAIAAASKGFTSAITAASKGFASIISEVATGRVFDDDSESRKIAENILGGAKQPEAPAPAPASTPKDITASGAKPSDYNASRHTKPSTETARVVASTPVPASQGVANQMVTSLTPVRSKRPTVMQTYNALSLLKGGVIDSNQLFNYLNTGQFNPAKAAPLKYFHDQKSGQVLALNENTAQGGLAYQFPREGAGAVDQDEILARNSRIRDSLRDQTIGDFTNREGELDVQGQETFVNMNEEITAVLGMGESNIGRANALRVNNMARGFQLVKNYQEPEGFLGLGNPFNNVDIPLTAGNVAIASQLTALGLRPGDAANRALKLYLGGLAELPGITAEKLIANDVIIKYESDIAALAQEEGISITEAREEYIEKQIEDFLKPKR
jgi:hypothetical protein